MSIKLGDKVKDVVSGFTGIAIARTEWLNKCVRVVVQAEKVSKADGKIFSEQFDEEQLEVVKPQAIVLNKQNQTGGPKDFMPSRR